MPRKINILPILFIVGPTAVGKTDLAIDLALKINGEIISADSRLLYRGMDIGTAKPNQEQMKMVPHHLIDVANPNECWSLALYLENAEVAINQIQESGKRVVFVGGTGQYVRAITEGWDVPNQEPDQRLRNVLNNWGIEIGAQELHQKLQVIDFDAAQNIEYQNIRRTIRALEVIFSTGKRFSEVRTKSEPKHIFYVIGLMRNREELYQRVDARIEKMFSDGLIEETQALLNLGITPQNPNMTAIGYREVCQMLDGQTTLEAAKNQMKKKTREFVRRQANWFKPDDPIIHWYEMNENTPMTIFSDLKNKGIC